MGFDNTFVRELPGDQEASNETRQVQVRTAGRRRNSGPDPQLLQFRAS